MAPQGKRGLQSCTDYQPRQSIALHYIIDVIMQIKFDMFEIIIIR